MNRYFKLAILLLTAGATGALMACDDRKQPSPKPPATTATATKDSAPAHGLCDPSGGAALAALGPAGKAKTRYLIDGVDVTRAVFSKQQEDLVEIQRGPAGYAPNEVFYDVFHTCSKSTKKPYTYTVTTSRKDGPHQYELVAAKLPPATPSAGRSTP